MEDIVYFAAGKKNEELRYSIRSVCKNFKTFRKLWIIGSKPDDIIPDGYIEMFPNKGKYGKIRYRTSKKYTNTLNRTNIKINNVTISQENGKYYASINIECEQEEMK